MSLVDRQMERALVAEERLAAYRGSSEGAERVEGPSAEELDEAARLLRAESSPGGE